MNNFFKNLFGPSESVKEVREKKAADAAVREQAAAVAVREQAAVDAAQEQAAAAAWEKAAAAAREQAAEVCLSWEIMTKNPDYIVRHRRILFPLELSDGARFALEDRLAKEEAKPKQLRWATEAEAENAVRDAAEAARKNLYARKQVADAVWEKANAAAWEKGAWDKQNLLEISAMVQEVSADAWEEVALLWEKQQAWDKAAAAWEKAEAPKKAAAAAAQKKKADALEKAAEESAAFALEATAAWEKVAEAAEALDAAAEAAWEKVEAEAWEKVEAWEKAAETAARKKAWNADACKEIAVLWHEAWEAVSQAAETARENSYAWSGSVFCKHPERRYAFKDVVALWGAVSEQAMQAAYMRAAWKKARVREKVEAWEKAAAEAAALSVKIARHTLNDLE